MVDPADLATPADPVLPMCATSAESGQEPNYYLVRDREGLTTVGTALGSTGLVALDLETTGLNPRLDRIRLLSLGYATIDGDIIIYLVDCFVIDPSPLWSVLATKELVIHNGVFDLAFLARLNFTPAHTIHDTMLFEHVLTAGTKDRVRLNDCCQRRLGRNLDKADQMSDWSGTLSPHQLAYAAHDVEVLLPLLKAQKTRIKDSNLTQAAEIECRCLPAIVWMAQSGVAVDAGGWRALSEAATAKEMQLKADLENAAPAKPSANGCTESWNWNSPQQVKQALALAGCPLESTADEALAAVDHLLARLLRQYRAASKQCSTYGADWLKHVADDGRVYANWRQTGAASGRMSCGDPNLQQLPRGEYRRCVAAPLGRVLVKADYSQIELRIAAKVSGDQALLEAYKRGDDLHTLTARSVLGIEEVTREHRQLAKAVNFGLLYGMGARGFRQYAQSQYGVILSEDEAQRYRAAFFKTYPGLVGWHQQVRRQHARETRTLSGRRRILDDQTFDTQRLNTPVQGTGADGLKLALGLLWERRQQVPGAFPVMAVHDEIVVECDKGQADVVAAWLKAAMTEAMAWLINPVPVKVDIKIGRTWGGD
jgi:DNA polymerase-1